MGSNSGIECLLVVVVVPSAAAAAADDDDDGDDDDNDVLLMQCSVSCDDGLRWRDVYCYDRGQLVSPQECDQLVAPPRSQPCNLQPCPHSYSMYLTWLLLTTVYRRFENLYSP